VDVGFDHAGVDPQSLTILHTEFDSGLDHSLMDGLHGVGSESVEGAIELKASCGK
jgi:hypothetical protein